MTHAVVLSIAVAPRPSREVPWAGMGRSASLPACSVIGLEEGWRQSRDGVHLL